MVFAPKKEQLKISPCTREAVLKMANEKGVKVKLWREGKNVLIRSDALHITTYGKDTKTALENFKEALALTLDAMTSRSVSGNRALPFEFELGSHYGRTTSKAKAAPAY